MNHSEKPVHTAHKHLFVFVQKTDKFWFVTSFLLTVCKWLAKSVHIYEHMICDPYTNGLVRKYVLAFRE